MKQKFTLCLLVKNEKVLLGRKKRGFGKGMWNGFGGKVEEGEAIEHAAIRELKEEVGIEAQDISKIGLLTFTFRSDVQELEVHVFKIQDYCGVPTESDEMLPRWFRLQDIPFCHMWPDDKYWFPYLLNDKTFIGRFHLDINGSTAKIIAYKIFEVCNL